MNKKQIDSSDYQFGEECVKTILGKNEFDQETVIRPILHPHGTEVDVEINEESIKIVAEILTS